VLQNWPPTFSHNIASSYIHFKSMDKIKTQYYKTFFGVIYVRVNVGPVLITRIYKDIVVIIMIKVLYNWMLGFISYKYFGIDLLTLLGKPDHFYVSNIYCIAMKRSSLGKIGSKLQPKKFCEINPWSRYCK
jgi:hypothetical protein